MPDQLGARVPDDALDLAVAVHDAEVAKEQDPRGRRVEEAPLLGEQALVLDAALDILEDRAVKMGRHAPQRGQEDHDEHRHRSIELTAANHEIRDERREHGYCKPEERPAARGENAHRRDGEPADQQSDEQLVRVRTGTDREDQDGPGAPHRRRTRHEATLPERSLGRGAVRSAIPPDHQIAQGHDDAGPGEPREQGGAVGGTPEHPHANPRNDHRQWKRSRGLAIEERDPGGGDRVRVRRGEACAVVGVHSWAGEPRV